LVQPLWELGLVARRVPQVDSEPSPFTRTERQMREEPWDLGRRPIGSGQTSRRRADRPTPHPHRQRRDRVGYRRGNLGCQRQPAQRWSRRDTDSNRTTPPPTPYSAGSGPRGTRDSHPPRRWPSTTRTPPPGATDRIKHGDQDMPAILSGPDGTTTTRSPRTTTQSPPNPASITPISSRPGWVSGDVGSRTR
jgi:hypothetical protein